MPSDAELGWLAGILDGEGSIGISCVRSRRRDGKPLYSPTVQMSTTARVTADRVKELAAAVGVQAMVYLYQEKKPDRHKPSHYIRVGRLADVLVLAQTIAPFAVEKRAQWEVVREFCERRLAGREILENGKVKHSWEPAVYSEEEVSLWQRAKELNQRGPT